MSPDQPSQKGAKPPEADEAPRFAVRLETSSDGMEARLSIVPAGEPARAIQELVARRLKEAGVRVGLDVAAVKEAIAQAAQGWEVREVVVARGRAPVAGAPGRLQLLVPEPLPRLGRVSPEGQVDFKDLGPAAAVNEGDQLARVIPPGIGAPGAEVSGREIPPPRPEKVELRAGEGVRLVEEGRVAEASRAGVLVRWEDDFLAVLEVTEAAGEDDLEPGTCTFAGLLRVKGALPRQCQVEAQFLEAQVMEPGSAVVAEGDVHVLGGVMGARIKAGGRIAARFIRDSSLEAVGDIVVERELVQCRVKTQGRLILSDPEARIVNCRIAALKGVVTAEVISSGEPTSIHIGGDLEWEQQVFDLRKQAKAEDQRLARMEEDLRGQREELRSTEQELKEIIANLKDPGQAAQREMLLAQVDMIKPLRGELMAGIVQAEAELDRQTSEHRRFRARLAELERYMPVGAAKLVARVGIEATTELKARRATLSINRNLGASLAYEAIRKDPETGASRHVIEWERLKA